MVFCVCMMWRVRELYAVVCMCVYVCNTHTLESDRSRTPCPSCDGGGGGSSTAPSHGPTTSTTSGVATPPVAAPSEAGAAAWKRRRGLKTGSRGGVGSCLGFVGVGVMWVGVGSMKTCGVHKAVMISARLQDGTGARRTHARTHARTCNHEA